VRSLKLRYRDDRFGLYEYVGFDGWFAAGGTEQRSHYCNEWPHGSIHHGKLGHWENRAVTAENFDKTLEGLKQRAPFHPFTVELIGGHRFEIDHPGALVVRDGVAVFISPGGVPVLFDHESVTHFVAELRKKRKTN
jgi:hypothetical protein